MTISNLQEIYYIFKNSKDFNEFYERVSDNNELRGCADYEKMFQALHEVDENTLVLTVYKHGFSGAIEKIYCNDL